MKKLAFIITLMVAFTRLNAQDNFITKSGYVSFFSTTPIEDILPEFKGGQDAFLKFAQANLSYPEKARRMGIEGRVFVKVVIEKDGSISNAEVVNGIGGGCDEEALKLFRISPKWIPGKQRGRSVRVSVTFPIKFTLSAI